MTELKTIKRRRTRKEHRCEFCGKIIPKGTPTDSLVRITTRYNVYSPDIKPIYLGKAFRTRYWHKDCYIIQELVGKIDKFRSDFHVYRTLSKVVYLIRGVEIEIDLAPKTQSFRERWNKIVKKSNEIYEFMRINGLLTYPELDLTRMEDKIDD